MDSPECCHRTEQSFSREIRLRPRLPHFKDSLGLLLDSSWTRAGWNPVVDTGVGETKGTVLFTTSQLQ